MGIVGSIHYCYYRICRTRAVTVTIQNWTHEARMQTRRGTSGACMAEATYHENAMIVALPRILMVLKITTDGRPCLLFSRKRVLK